jgi:hypothetical protein
MYQGNDSREFLRAEDRITYLYDELGLPEYEAIEALSDLIIKKRNLKRIKIFMKYIVYYC